MRFRCSSALLWLLCAAAHAQGSQDDAAWLEKSRQILNDASHAEAPDWLRTAPTPQAADQAQAVLDASTPPDVKQARVQMSQARTLIFGSLSLPRPTLKALLLEASEQGVVFLLRGVPPGKSVKDCVNVLKEVLGTDRERVPNVLIDPSAFQQFSVSVVPTVVTYAHPPYWVRIEGDIGLGAFHRMADASPSDRNVSLARNGRVSEIAEPDLVQELQRRMMAFDIEARRKRAIEQFWNKKRDFVELPTAATDNSFTVDPSVEVTEDIVDADDHVLVHAGDRMNPLQYVTLSKVVIAFKGTDSKQVQRALTEAQKVHAMGRGVILLTSTIDTARGWDHLSELESGLAGTVYVLPRVLAERFQLKHLPSVIRSEGTQLVVTELGMGSTP